MERFEGVSEASSGFFPPLPPHAIFHGKLIAAVKASWAGFWRCLGSSQEGHAVNISRLVNPPSAPKRFQERQNIRHQNVVPKRGYNSSSEIYPSRRLLEVNLPCLKNRMFLAPQFKLAVCCCFLAHRIVLTLRSCYSSIYLTATRLLDAVNMWVNLKIR